MSQREMTCRLRELPGATLFRRRDLVRDYVLFSGKRDLRPFLTKRVCLAKLDERRLQLFRCHAASDMLVPSNCMHSAE
jgi:hypothetical protein